MKFKKGDRLQASNTKCRGCTVKEASDRYYTIEIDSLPYDFPYDFQGQGYTKLVRVAEVENDYILNYSEPVVETTTVSDYIDRLEQLYRNAVQDKQLPLAFQILQEIGDVLNKETKHV